MRKIQYRFLPLLINIIILLFISVISYKFYSSSFSLQLVSCPPASSSGQGEVSAGFTWDIRLLSTVFSFLTSFCFSYYVLDKFTYSDNKYIRILQRFLFLNILIILLSAFIIYIFSYLSIIPTVYCSSGEENIRDVVSGESKDNSLLPPAQEIFRESTAATPEEYYYLKIPTKSVDMALSNVLEVSKVALQSIVPQMGAGAAAGAVGSAVVKSTTGLPLIARAGILTGSVFVTAAATAVGLNTASALFKSKDLKSEIKSKLDSNSPSGQEYVSSYPGAAPTSGAVDDYINSPLENGDYTSPLQDLLLSSLVLDIISLLLLIIVILIIFNRYILSFNLNIINKIVNKYLPINIRNWFNNKLNTSLDFNNKFVLFMFIFSSLLLICILCFKIFITSELFINLNSHIEVHDYYHSKKS